MELDELVTAVARLRADLQAQQLLVEALLLALPPPSRAIVRRHFAQHSERYMSAGLYLAAQDDSLERMQAAVDRVGVRIEALT